MLCVVQIRCPDYSGEGTEAHQRGDANVKQQVANDDSRKAFQHSYNFHLLAKNKTIPRKQGKMMKQPPRKKSYTQLNIIDHQLRISTGVGLKRYRISETDVLSVPPEKWARLNICCDEANEHVSMARWMQTSAANNMNITFSFDLVHAGWNGCKQMLSLRPCGLTAHIQ